MFIDNPRAIMTLYTSHNIIVLKYGLYMRYNKVEEVDLIWSGAHYSCLYAQYMCIMASWYIIMISRTQEANKAKENYKD